MLFWTSIAGLLLANLSLASLGPIGKHLDLFSALYGITFLLLWAVMKTFPADWPGTHQVGFIFLTTVTVHIAFLAFPASYDVNRYVWESYLLNKGDNPFLHAPNDPVLAPFIADLPDIWPGVNQKDASACYPPLSMLIFRGAAYLSPSKFFFKGLILLFNLAAIGVLVRLTQRYELPLSRVLLYALNPLVLVFIAGEGHLDSIQVFFMCVSFYFFKQHKDHWGFVALGCAIMSKYFAVIFTPFLLNAKNWKKSLWLIGTVVFWYLPFWGTGFHLFTSLVPFGTVMHYNDSLTVLLRDLFGAYTTGVSIIILGICLLIIFLLVHDPLRSSYFAAGCLLLLLATLHPWYLTFLTPFLVFFPSRAWLYLHLAVAFTFPVLYIEQETGVFQEMHWIKLFEYLPFYGLLIYDRLRNRARCGIRTFQPVRSISVIIPTLNEARNIERCLDALRGNPAVGETIVVDGGSTDGTQEIAARMGVPVFSSQKGRGPQITTGISQAHGDVILILHADCVIRKDIPERMLHTLNTVPHCIGGAVGMAYLHRTFSNRVIAGLNNMRARVTGIAFGDQVQFFRTEALPLIGGFPDMMMMEDLELSMRLKEQGALDFLPNGVSVSTRRWEKVGSLSNARWVVWSCLSHLVQRRLGIGDPQGRDFYERYYAI